MEIKDSFSIDFDENRRVRRFKGNAQAVAFPLGGIGTGNVSVGARGELRDWEIFNRPAKGNHLPYSFFAIRAQPEGQKAVTKVLESRINPPHTGATGYPAVDLAGLPRLESSILEGKYPFVTVEFEDSRLPVNVLLEAFTPFIPLNSDDSGIPGAVIRYSVKNISPSTTEVSIAGSLPNPVGFEGYDHHQNLKLIKNVENVFKKEEGLTGLFFTTDLLSPKHLLYGSMALLTTAEQVTVKPSWLKGGWWDGVHDFWSDFSEDGLLETQSVFDTPLSNLYSATKMEVGSLCINDSLQPGETKVFEFILSWYFPNRPDNWYALEDLKKLFDNATMEFILKEAGLNLSARVEKNYYGKIFQDAWGAGKYLAVNLERLEGKSRGFTETLFGSTLPPTVIEALANNIPVIRSTTCFRLENGSFLAFEGSYDDMGACPGNCTHVWNYAQTMAFLFPDLEHSMRHTEFALETEKDGKMNFRSMRVFDQEAKALNPFPAVDGQLGCLIRLYRDWKLSGDETLLRPLWEKAASALDFAFGFWDPDGDFVLEAQQHNTYDIDFYGPNSHSSSIFYGALKAGLEMAEYLNDKDHTEKYRQAWEQGSQRMDRLLWNGEYYIQQLNDINSYRYQYGNGCLSDQILGQFLAHVAGLGYILPQGHVKKALSSIYRYNYQTSFFDHQNVQRTFVLNDEKGLVLCSWPKGGRPRLPFVYADEVWTGVEYQVAANLIWEGFLEKGLELVKAVRERHDGYRRNPWNEVECGHHYARSLSSWALLLAISGFQYDLVKGEISFTPVYQKEDFSTFWSTAKAWGIYRQKIDKDSGDRQWEVKVLYGTLGDSIKINGQLFTTSLEGTYNN
jgi:non-lysosomal glucosylceramidase